MTACVREVSNRKKGRVQIYTETAELLQFSEINSAPMLRLMIVRSQQMTKGDGHTVQWKKKTKYMQPQEEQEHTGNVTNWQRQGVVSTGGN